FQIFQNCILSAWGKTLAVWKETQNLLNLNYTLTRHESTHEGSINHFFSFISGTALYMLTSSSDKTIKAWSLVHNKIQELATIEALEAPLTTLGGNIASVICGDTSGNVHVWDHQSSF